MAKKAKGKPGLTPEEQARQYVAEYNTTPAELLARWRQHTATIAKPYLKGPTKPNDKIALGTTAVFVDVGNGLEGYILDRDLTTTPNDANRANTTELRVARVAIDALHAMHTIENSSHPSAVLRATVSLGIYFQRMDFLPFEPLIAQGAATLKGRTKGIRNAIQKRTKMTTGPRVQAISWMKELIASGSSERNAYQVVSKRFAKQGLVIKPSTIRSHWKRTDP